MFAAAAGDIGAITTLLDKGAAVNAQENDRLQTPLIFAAATDRLDAVKLLLARGADPNAATKLTDLNALSRNGENPDGRNLAVKPETTRRRPAPARPLVPGVERQHLVNEQVAWQGGMTPLLYAARQGHIDVAKTLLDAGVDVNQRKGGDLSSALLVATVNGQFDLAGIMLERGANPNLVAENGVGPLYATINLMWAPRAGYPQPRAHLNQKVGYLDLMKRLLDAGADPNQRVTSKVWYTNYNFDQSGVDEAGATPFWRAAYGADVDAMKLLRLVRRRSADPDDQAAGAPGDRRCRPARIARRVRLAANPDRRSGRPAAARRGWRRLRRRLRRQLPSSCARRDARGGQISRRGTRR